MDILEFALEFETKSRDFYLEMAKDAGLKELKTLFEALAADEVNHIRVLSALKNRAEIDFESNNLDQSEKAFAGIVGSKIDPGTFSKLKVLNQAYAFEDESMKYYKEKSESAEKVSERLLFLRLYFEEKKHREIINDLIEFNTFIETSLATAEFEK